MQSVQNVKKLNEIQELLVGIIALNNKFIKIEKE
jgi:hypothetical protein